MVESCFDLSAGGALPEAMAARSRGVSIVKVEYVEESSVRKALVFEIDATVVSTEIDAKAKEMARKVRLPGFRPGRTPEAVVKQRFRSEIFSDAAETIVNRVVFGELEGRGLQPLAAPRIKDLVIEESRPMTFRAVFETLPVVELPEYRGLTVKAKQAVLEEQDVEKEIERLREEAARFDPVEDRVTENGDFLAVDLTWKPVEGVEEAATRTRSSRSGQRATTRR